MSSASVQSPASTPRVSSRDSTPPPKRLTEEEYDKHIAFMSRAPKQTVNRFPAGTKFVNALTHDFIMGGNGESYSAGDIILTLNPNSDPNIDIKFISEVGVVIEAGNEEFVDDEFVMVVVSTRPPMAALSRLQ